MFAGFFRLGIRQINADYRRSLSQSIAFENFFPEAFLKVCSQFERQFFGAGNDEAQAAELLRLSFAQIQAQKSGR